MSKLSRKKFLRRFSLVGLGALASGTGLLSNAAAQSYSEMRPLGAIGLQLYTIIPPLRNDFEGTLKTLAEIGYKEVEFAGPYYFSPDSDGTDSGYYGNSAGEMRALLDKYGLTGPAAHVGLETLRSNLPGALEAATTVGTEYLICPFLSPEERKSLDDYKKIAEEFNKIGEQCKKAGIRFGYHNHSFEFGTMDGEIPYNLLLESTEPDLVAMELDLFWITVAGFDPIEYFKSYPGRFHAVHVKDMKKKMVLEDPVGFDSMKLAFGNLEDPGKGILDFERIFSYHEQAGIQHYFVERDRPPNPMETVKNAYNYLSSIDTD